MTNQDQKEYIFQLLKEKKELQIKYRAAEASKRKAIKEKNDLWCQLKISEQLRKLEQHKCKNLIVEKVGWTISLKLTFDLPCLDLN